MYVILFLYTTRAQFYYILSSLLDERYFCFVAFADPYKIIIFVNDFERNRDYSYFVTSSLLIPILRSLDSIIRLA